MSAERENWHMYLNPCGSQPVRGFALKRCFPACEERPKPICLASGAFQIVGYLFRGSTVETERRDYKDFLRGNLGQVVVDLEGNPVTLTFDNIDSITDTAVARAQGLLLAANRCIEMTRPLSEEYYTQCTDEQREVLNRMTDLNDEAGRFIGNREQARELIDKMRVTLAKAIELDLDELGLVTRQAIAYGLGEQVLEKRGISADVIPTKLGKLGRISRV